MLIVSLINLLSAFSQELSPQNSSSKQLSKYWFKEHTIEEMIAPLNSESENDNRPGTIKESTQYVVVHDTASSAPTANEYAHAKYVSNGGGGTSWHYSVGDNASIHQIPDNEVAYHAGDTTQYDYTLYNTGVKVSDKLRDAYNALFVSDYKNNCDITIGSTIFEKGLYCYGHCHFGMFGRSNRRSIYRIKGRVKDERKFR